MGRRTGFPNGRPTKFRASMIDVLGESIAKGGTISYWARLYHVDRGTIVRWIRRGKRDAEAGRNTKFAALAVAVAEARRKFNVTMWGPAGRPPMKSKPVPDSPQPATT